MDKPVILITGCSTGIGRHAVSYLAKQGAYVIATARNPDTLTELVQPGSVEAHALDVTDHAQCKTVVDTVLAAHGRIDGLVNNAGYGVNLPVEETDVATMQAMFDVNVFGAHHLTQLVLPQMREAGRGRIVNVASVAAHVAVPMMGTYCATKFALRALTQSLHNEVRSFGIRASLVEPGVIRTHFGTRARSETSARQAELEAGPYGHLHKAWDTQRMNQGGADPVVISRLIAHACLDASPKFHYFAPLHAKAGNILNRIVPDSWLNAGFRLWFRARARKANRPND